MAAILSLAAIGLSAAPTEAFSEVNFIKVWNANTGVVRRAADRMVANPTPWQVVRTLREIARAENRVVLWLRDHPASACQRPWVRVVATRGVEARKSFKASARSLARGNVRTAESMMQRGFRFHAGMYVAGGRMIVACP